MSRLFIYDTSNFIDFPIGGQLTSKADFLPACYNGRKRFGEYGQFPSAEICKRAVKVQEIVENSKKGLQLCTFAGSIRNREAFLPCGTMRYFFPWQLF